MAQDWVEIPTQSDPFIPVGMCPPIPVESDPRGLKSET